MNSYPYLSIGLTWYRACVCLSKTLHGAKYFLFMKTAALLLQIVTNVNNQAPLRLIF